MEFPVITDGKTVGNCTVTESGLYWQIRCVCALESEEIVRLYCGETNIGVLMPEGSSLVLRKKVSKASAPDIPPCSGMFSLEPVKQPVPWEGKLAGVRCSGLILDDVLLFSYDASQPCPCEPLICFFEIRDGFWRLPAEMVKAAD